MNSGTTDETEYFVDVIDEQPVVKRRELDDSEMDITPMIDITFLLLIFFLVAAKMDEDTPVELPPAKHGTAVAVKSSVIITLAQTDSGSAEVYLGDGKSPDRLVDGRDLEAQSAAITAYVEEELGSGKDKTNVLIKAEKGVKHRDVSRVSLAVGQAGQAGESLYVAVLEVQ